MTTLIESISLGVSETTAPATPSPRSLACPSRDGHGGRGSRSCGSTCGRGKVCPAYGRFRAARCVRTIPRPRRSLYRSGIAQEGDAHVVGTWNDGRVSGQAETTFEELHLRRRLYLKHRINDHMKRDRLPLALSDLLGREARRILLFVLNNRELQRHPDLGRGQSDSGCIVHGLVHMLDELLDLRAVNLCRRERPCPLSQNGFADGGDFQFHDRYLLPLRVTTKHLHGAVVADNRTRILCNQGKLKTVRLPPATIAAHLIHLTLIWTVRFGRCSWPPR